MKTAGNTKIKWVPYLFLTPIAIGINLVSSRQEWIENWYSTGIYPYIGRFFRFIFGWLPVSFGDILYFLAGSWILYKLYRLFRVLKNKDYNRKTFFAGLIRYVVIALSVYILFNLFWGLNYNRAGIAYQLRLNVKERPKEELSALTTTLLSKTNEYSKPDRWKKTLKSEAIFREAINSYRTLSVDFAFLQYQPRSIKASLYGIAGNYIGYTGYFNPFTSEAQINDKVPMAVQPFVACHEIAHQLGYAKENEANFVGFLAASTSSDTAFRYSAYFEMFLYANAELFLKDSTAARRNFQLLSPEAKSDLAELRAFRIKYENPLDKAVSLFYDKYLKLNQQPSGTRTYNKVVSWLLAWYAEKGRI